MPRDPRPPLPRGQKMKTYVSASAAIEFNRGKQTFEFRIASRE
jgi:hypothetical protein